MANTVARREEVIARVDRWAELFDTHVGVLIEELYHLDCRVDVKNGISFHGADVFTEIELAVAAQSPGRHLSVERVHVVGETAVVLAAVEFPHQGTDAPPSRMCALLTFDGDRIAVDESYMDLRNWPTPPFSGAQWARLLDPKRPRPHNPEPVVEGRPAVEGMVDRVQRWAALYNDRIEEFANAYTVDCRLDVGNGVSFSGRDDLTTIEVAVEKVAPGRRMEIDRILLDGSTAIVLATAHFPHDPDIPANELCAVLTFEEDLIAHDETFMDLRYWPTPKFDRSQWTELLA